MKQKKLLPLFESVGLFDQAIVPQLEVSPLIDQLMKIGATLVINISGGKDSQAMTKVLVQEYRQRSWRGQLVAVHANLGRADWSETLPFSQKIASESGLRIEIVSTKNGDLIDLMKRRMDSLAGKGKPHWPSKPNRYCTSDSKRSPIDKFLRQFPIVISAEGIRAEESTDRAKKSVVEIRQSITSKSYENLSLEEAIAKHSSLIKESLDKKPKRLAINWYPLLNWKVEAVWNACGTTSKELLGRRSLYNVGQQEEALEGWPCHPAYVRGMSRLSCVFCIFGSRNELSIAKIHKPDLYQELVTMEEISGFSFRKELALATL